MCGMSQMKYLIKLEEDRKTLSGGGKLEFEWIQI